MCTCPTGRMRDSKNVSHGESKKLTECVPWGEWETHRMCPMGRVRNSQNVSHGESEKLTECVPWGEWETHRMCPMRRVRLTECVPWGEWETHRMCPMGRVRNSQNVSHEEGETHRMCPTGRVRNSQNVSYGESEKLTECVPWGGWDSQKVSHRESEKLTECVPWGGWDSQKVSYGETEIHRMCPMGRMRDSQNVSHGENERFTECVPWGEWETHRMCPMGRMRNCALHSKSYLDSLLSLNSGGVMYLVFTHMPGESYRGRLRSLLRLCSVFRVLINSHVCWFFHHQRTKKWTHNVRYLLPWQQILAQGEGGGSLTQLRPPALDPLPHSVHYTLHIVDRHRLLQWYPGGRENIRVSLLHVW